MDHIPSIFVSEGRNWKPVPFPGRTDLVFRIGTKPNKTNFLVHPATLQMEEFYPRTRKVAHRFNLNYHIKKGAVDRTEADIIAQWDRANEDIFSKMKQFAPALQKLLVCPCYYPMFIEQVQTIFIKSSTDFKFSRFDCFMV